MSVEILGAVFDCNVFVQALLNPNSVAVQCLDVVRRGDVKLFISNETLAEIRDVVSRPNIIKRLPNADIEQIEAFVEDVLNFSILIRSVPKSFKLTRDPKDEIIINLAVESESEYIVSRDKDLLDLMTSFDDDSKEFRQRFRRLKIVEPLEFIRIVKEQN